MLFNPDSMPEFKKTESKKKKNFPKQVSARVVSLRQKPVSKHTQPDIYIETKVEKRKS